MKITRSLALVLLFSLSLLTVRAQVRQADEMVRKIFTSLQTKDEKTFLSLYPTGAQFAGMMRSIMAQVLNSPEVKQAMAMDSNARNMNIDSMVNAEVGKMSTPEAYAEMQKKFSATFREVLEKGEKKGVNWSEAKLTNITIDSTAEMGGEMAALKTSGIKAMKGVIDFRSGATDYQMSFDKIIYLPAEGGWFGGEFPQLVRKGESLDAKESGEGDAPAPKTKTKTKTSASGTKTKTKSAAGKTKTKA